MSDREDKVREILKALDESIKSGRRRSNSLLVDEAFDTAVSALTTLINDLLAENDKEWELFCRTLILENKFRSRITALEARLASRANKEGK